MTQIKVKLSRYEVCAIQLIMWQAAQRELRPDMRNETIILAENWQTWSRKHEVADKRKLKTYTIALSLARILHDRLQRIPQTHIHQSILDKLDQELTNIGMKPPFQLTLT